MQHGVHRHEHSHTEKYKDVLIGIYYLPEEVLRLADCSGRRRGRSGQTLANLCCEACCRPDHVGSVRL